MPGLYIHIPFCKTRCIYCAFYSTTGQEALVDDYIDALIHEMHLRRDYLSNRPINTIYIGGGTPSRLTPAQLQHLRDAIPAQHPDEFTIECNPDDITPDYAKALALIGINRVSMGVQTFSDDILHFLHRRHNSHDIPRAVQHLREAGINNISIDLMFGFPDETLQQWQHDIQQAINLHVQHISAYSLTYEEGTPLHHMLQKGTVTPIHEDLSRQMFETLILQLTHSGYEHYEISNFAAPGYRSQHNSSYWHDVPYLGIGAGAHSYNRSSRQWNISDIHHYIKAINNGVIPCQKEDIDDTIHYNDLVTTALRTKEGINLSTLQPHYREYLLHNAQKAIRYGNLRIDHNLLHLTTQAIFISDDIMADLVMV